MLKLMISSSNRLVDSSPEQQTFYRFSKLMMNLCFGSITGAFVDHTKQMIRDLLKNSCLIIS